MWCHVDLWVAGCVSENTLPPSSGIAQCKNILKLEAAISSEPPAHNRRNVSSYKMWPSKYNLYFNGEIFYVSYLTALLIVATNDWERRIGGTAWAMARTVSNCVCSKYPCAVRKLSITRLILHYHSCEYLTDLGENVALGFLKHFPYPVTFGVPSP